MAYVRGDTVFSDPLQFLAADVNEDQVVDIEDAFVLFSVMTGAAQNFPDNRSYIFIPAETPMPDVKSGNVLLSEWKNSLAISPLSEDMTDLDFIAVKIGDVTGGVDPSGLGTLQTRSSKALVAEDRSINEGETFDMILSLEDLHNVEAYQFTFEWNNEYLELVEIVPNLGLGMNLDNFGLNRISEGVITTSWNRGEREVRQSEERLFLIRFRGLNSGRLSELITASSLITEQLAYVGEGLVEVDLHLEFTSGRENNYFALYQNEPNPWNASTAIRFHLPEDQLAVLNVFDDNGRLVARKEGLFQKGLNTVETKDHTATRKMVLIE